MVAAAARPFLPRVRYMRRFQQSAGQRMVAEVGLGELTDGDPAVRARDALDGVSGADLARLGDAQVGPRAARGREALQEPRVAHPQAQLEARKPWLADLQHRGPDPPALADHRGRHVDPTQRQILTEVAGLQFTTELLLPPKRVLPRIRVHRLVGPAVDSAVGLVVAREIHPTHDEPALDGDLPDRGRDGAITDIDRAHATDVHRHDMS